VHVHSACDMCCYVMKRSARGLQTQPCNMGFLRPFSLICNEGSLTRKVSACFAMVCRAIGSGSCILQRAALLLISMPIVSSSAGRWTQ
jgi:hypothetical protein